MEVYHGKLYVAGYFDYMGGQYRKSLATWDGTQWETPFRMPDNGLDPGGYIQALYRDADTMYFGGNFVTLGWDSSYYIACMYDGNWEFDQTPKDNSLYAMTRKDDTLFVMTGGGVHLPGDTCRQKARPVCPWLLKFTSRGFRTDLALDIDEVSDDHYDIHISPVPTSDRVLRRGDDLRHVSSIQLIDMLGQVVHVWEDIPRSLDVIRYATGVYLLRFDQGTSHDAVLRRLMIE